jgi:uncharacterized protein (DUF488 family)
MDLRGALFTIGHSTRPLDEFLALLQGHRVTQLADVRTIPRSRHNPQFNADTLAAALTAASITYRHYPELGGLRHPTRESINQAWRNTSFRGYADYMQTPAFAQALDRVIAEAQAGERLAIMCAEGAPFRCHRSLIADALVALELPVSEITSATKAAPHRLTSFAHVANGHVTYPGGS